MKLVPVLLSIIILSSQSLTAAVSIEMRESSGGVSVTFSGSLDTTGGSYQGGSSVSRNKIEGPKLPFLGEPNWEFDWVDTANGGVQWYLEVTSYTTDFSMESGVFTTSDSYGDTFGFNAFDSGGPQLNTRLPAFYPPFGGNAQEFSGGMSFSGESFDSMGMTEGQSFHFELANGDTISAVVVPEPSSALLLGLGAIGFVTRRRRTS